ncbi:MAG TPA: lactonase family protein [Terriglobales bacterium]|nr:lactonase family protein [Terriglobales bacterium]
MRMHRWQVIASIFAIVIFLVLSPFAQAGNKRTANTSYQVFVGTYTGPTSKGIYGFHFDPATGQASSVNLIAETTSPSFLAIAANHRFLYAVNETSEYQGQKTGAVSSFAIDPKTGRLALLNQVSSRGAGPCYITLDKTGKHVLVANYDSGSVAVFPVLADGRLGEVSAVVQHTGHGVDPERQEAPHAHSIELSPDNRFGVATDLGLDELLVYRYDPINGTLAPNHPPFAKVEPGVGSRHFAFHPSGRFAYVINEMSSSVTGFSYDAKHGRFSKLQSISALPKGFTGHSDAAEIEAHPSGKFLYASTRGPDSIAVFRINPKSGKLALLETVPTGGKTPRNFAIDPSGAYLFAANQESNNIVIFRIDPRTGHLTATSKVIEAPAPVCLKFLAVQ